jgi:hypothetical protein
VCLLSNAKLVDLLLVGLAIDGEGCRGHADSSGRSVNNLGFC